MGPITLFDKSFLQSLSLDESVWFDNFFLTNISPVFFVETLADLEKNIRKGRTPEQEVRIIGEKTPEMGSSPNQFHVPLCIGNLLGKEIPMTGQIILGGGRIVKTADQSGVIFEHPPELQALLRWKDGEFLQVERLYAKAWRKILNVLDFRQTLEGLNSIGIKPGTYKTLEDIKKLGEGTVNQTGYSFDRMRFLFEMLGIPFRYFMPVWERWGFSRFPSLQSFAPYAAFLLQLEIFYFMGAASNLFSTRKITNKIDLAYLYYLPFCMMFVSSDNFHRRCAPLFLRDDQLFIWGPDLKEDLHNIDHYYEKFPPEEKEKGLYAFAGHPPKQCEFLVTRLWDRFLPNWRHILENPPHITKEVEKHLVEHIHKFVDKPTLTQEEIDFDPSNPDALIVQHKIGHRKGKWWQLARDFKEKRELN